MIGLSGIVMPALVAGIHVFKAEQDQRRGLPGKRPAMTDADRVKRIGIRSRLRIEN
jgi:hypothetical protein